MDLAFNIVALVVSLASLIGMIGIARGNWSRADKRSIEQRLAHAERELSKVDERIKDAVHKRVSVAVYSEFMTETREKLERLRTDLTLGLHTRLSKDEFREFKQEYWPRK